MHNADVIIIGGGPAGSTAASLLAGAGRRVLLFEKEVFPRFHIGESLLPFNMDLFRRLGLDGRLDAAFIQKWGARLVSSDGAVSRYIEFADGIAPGYPMAYHVLRSRFDEMLLQNAETRGAVVMQGTAVVEAACSHRDGCEVTVRDAGGAVSRHRARFLLDASGRDAFLASRRRLRVMSPSLRKAAVFAHYENVPRAEGREAGDIILIVLEDGWFWMIPLPGKVTSVGLVTDAAWLKRGRLPPDQLLEESLRRCPEARRRMQGSMRLSPVWSASDYRYDCSAIAGDGYLMMGDSAAFIDPIFSTGVWLAMSSAEMAADTLHRALGDGARSADLSPAVFAGYERKVRRHVQAYKKIVGRFYQPGFMDLFLNPRVRFGTKESVISLLAGMADPPPLTRLRLACFYAQVRLHQHVRVAPRVPLLRVMEEPSALAGSACVDPDASQGRA